MATVTPIWLGVARERLDLARLHSVAEAMAAVGVEAVCFRQHRAVICRAFIPAVLLARHVCRAASLDRRFNPLATLAIWLGSHIGPSFYQMSRRRIGARLGATVSAYELAYRCNWSANEGRGQEVPPEASR